MASNYGVPTVIDQSGVVLDTTSTAVSTVGGGNGGNEKLQKMDGFDTIKEVFFEIRDGINHMVSILSEGLELEQERFRKEGLAGRNKAIVSGNTDPDPPPPTAGGMDKGILESLKEALSGIGGAGKGLLGIAGLIAAYFLFNALSDTLAKALAPVLEFLGETLIPNIQELNDIILSHPGGYWTLLGAGGLIVTLNEVFGIKGSLNKLFTLISNFARTAFIDDIDFRTKAGKSWAGKINRALYGTKSGTGGLFPKLSRSFTNIGSGLRNTFAAEEFAKALKVNSTSWRLSINNALLGKGGPRGGGGGLLSKLGTAIRNISSSLRSTFLPEEFAKALKLNTMSWRASITGGLLGKGGPRGGGGGMLSKLGTAIRSIGSLIRGIFSSATLTKTFATISRITSRFGRVMARVGRTITKALGFVSKISGLSAFLKLGLAFAKAIPIVGQVIMVVQGLFGFVTGAIEGYKTGGILGAVKGGLIGLYDGLLGSFLNLIADILGWIFKKLGLTGLGNFFSNLDFTFEGLKNAMITVFDSIRWALNKAINGMKWLVNKAIQALNWVPGIDFEPLEYSEFKPTERTNPQPVKEPPEVEPSFLNTDSQLATIKSQKVEIGGINAKELMSNVDYGMNDVKYPVFAPTTMSGGTTNVSNNSTTTSGFSSTHSDDIAKTLTEIYAE